MKKFFLLILAGLPFLPVLSAETVNPVSVKAETLRKQGNFSEAQKLLEDALKKSPNDPDILFELGMIHQKSATPDMLMSNASAGKSSIALAKKYFHQVLKINPRHAPALAQLADTYLFEDDFKKALYLANKSISIDRNLSLPYRVRGYTYIALGYPEKASSDFTQYLKKDDDFRTIMTKAEIDEELGNYASAYKYNHMLLSVINRKRLLLISREAIKLKIARCAARIGKTKESFEILDKLIEQDPKNSEAYLEKARLYRQLKDKKKSLYNYNIALSIKYSPKVLEEKNSLR